MAFLALELASEQALHWRECLFLWQQKAVPWLIGVATITGAAAIYYGAN
ncbi:hypothetical protein ACVRWB_05505 [Streptococcus troglodytae]|nr:hypothetical protein [Streptococcus troglodytae]